MMQWLDNVGVYIQSNPWLAIAAVFVGGVLTATNPCVLAMIPLAISFVGGRQESGLGPLRALAYSATFMLGLCITFMALGMMAALTGGLYGETGRTWHWIVAGVCVVMGLHLMGLLPLRLPGLRVQPKVKGLAGALLLGLLFGFVSLPCAGPILIVLLTYLASSNSSILFGGLLLLVYGLGHSVLILVAGTSIGVARKLIESRQIVHAMSVLRSASGVLIIGVGAYFFYLAIR